VAVTAARLTPDTGAEPVWRLKKTLADDVLSLAAWLAFAWVVYRFAFPVTSPRFALVYMMFILYFTRLYFRLLIVPLWAANTLQLLYERTEVPPRGGASVPHFFVFIAAYKAQGSIESMLEALRLQDYPRDRFDVYVVTQESENKERDHSREKIKHAIERVQAGECPSETSELALQVLAEALRRAANVEGDAVGHLGALATASLCLREDIKLTANRVADWLIAHYFRQVHEGRAWNEFEKTLRWAGVELSSRHARWLERCASECLSAADVVIGDFSRILGSPRDGSIFRDPGKRVRLALRLAGERPLPALRYRNVRRALAKRVGPFLSSLSPAANMGLTRATRTPRWVHHVEAACESWDETCPETVERAVISMGAPNIHHICREKEGGGKPESLNTAYFHVLGENPQALQSAHVIVVDADSLLHSSSLAVIAEEIRNDKDRNVIRQVAPLSTSNYAGNNVFVKMISCLDTIGSMGKWARNTRTLARPDLPAGSGLIIPATLLEYLRRTKGAPWETKTITEDARLVITDYGLLDGASRKTKFVPIHMLEAVPEARSLWQVFKQYWAQRMRWASGGPDEIIEMLRAFPGERVYAGIDTPSALRRPTKREKVQARYKQLKLLMGWAADHAWWGAGYGLAPIIWLVFAFLNITPPVLRTVGLCLLLGTPALVIFGLFRRFSGFVPGGLRFLDLCRLYLGTVVFAWLHTWPIMYTQFLYLIGQRKRFRTWTTTAKPRF
jgi:cellulose synthase/poly-beta-1,6-N-acetylglucosamine synthase-like glycosyltransferase